MTLDFSGLSDLARDPERATAGHEPLSRARLGHGRVLAFDQSLTATGWVKVVHSPSGLVVQEADTLKAGEGTKGVETDLTRGVDLFERARAVIWGNPGYHLVHESPPNMAALKGKGSPVSSLLSAQALRCAAASVGREITMLGAMPAKKLVSGQSKDKVIAHDALKRDCFPWIEGSALVTNEATRDALLIALLYLERISTTPTAGGK